MLVVLLAVIASIGTQTASAANVVVGTCTTGVHFSDITTAIASVPAGSTIRICPGTYAEQLTIHKNLTLTGLLAGTSDAVILTVPSSPLPTNATSLFQNVPTAANIAILGTAGTPITVNLNNLVVDGLHNGYSCPDRHSGGTNVVGILYQYAKGTANHVTTRNQLSDTQLSGCQGGFGFSAEGPSSAPGTENVVTLQYSSVHDYNKNGVVGTGFVTLNVLHNVVTGSGPTDMLAQNGIEYFEGAGGKIFDNQVAGDRYTGGGGIPSAASGIILYDAADGSASTPLSSNTISQTDLGISLNFDSGAATDNGYTIIGNNIGQSTLIGVEVCAVSNMSIMNNRIYNSGLAAVNLDTEGGNSCSSAPTTGNNIHRNTLVDACAGVLGDTGDSSTDPNTDFDVVATVLSGETCPAAGGPVALVAGPAASTQRHAANP